MNMMAQDSTTKGGLSYDQSILDKHDIPPELTWLKNKLYGYLNNESTQDDWMNDTSQKMKDIRHKYFHFSARYNIKYVYGIRFRPYKPQWSDGERKRTLHAG